MRKIRQYFSKGEWLLWSGSVIVVILCFVLFDGENYPALFASLLGSTMLIFVAKGNPVGHVLGLIFALVYGGISFTCAYYGEMLTYLGMTAPMAVFSLVSWYKHPYKGNRAQVQVGRMRPRDVITALWLTAAVTAVLYVPLKYFHTARLPISTFSVSTSFLAAYLTYCRSPYYALAYAANDLVLIVLWTLASLTDTAYVSMVVCFSVFFIHDIYGFINWQNMRRRQAAG